jgi:hypothetical protein
MKMHWTELCNAESATKQAGGRRGLGMRAGDDDASSPGRSVNGLTKAIGAVARGAQQHSWRERANGQQEVF